MDYTPLRMDPSLPPLSVNLYSDTQTKPTAAMKAAMLEAEVGDEQFGWDPTTNLLQERMAALMGKEAALFLPSGTMCNQIAIATHCRPGDEILAHETAHVLARHHAERLSTLNTFAALRWGDQGTYFILQHDGLLDHHGDHDFRADPAGLLRVALQRGA